MSADLHEHPVSRIWLELTTYGFDGFDTVLTPGHFRKR